MNINIERVPLQRVDLPPFNEQVFVNSETRCKQDHSGVHVISSSGSRGGAKGAMAPPGPVKIGHAKKMAAEGGRIDFMFLAPPLTRPLDPLLH